MTKLVKVEIPFNGLGDAIEYVITNQLDNWETDFDSVEVEVDRESIAADWLELYSQQISEALNIDDVMLSFDELISPREYNFQNDRIIANITEAKLAILWNAMQELYSPNYMQDKAEDLFLSRDGFISFNSELAKPENWFTLENPFLGLLWLPTSSEFEELMGYDLNLHIIEELYSQGRFDNNVSIQEL